MANIVTVSGMFGKVNGQGHTYFADSPVVIDISGLYWGSPVTSPFTIVRVEVLYNNNVVGDFRADTGGQTSTSFDISSALRAIWSDYNFDGNGNEVKTAQSAITANAGQSKTRNMRSYILHIYTEYLSSDDGGVYTTTQCAVQIDGVTYTDIPGGQCLMGGLTEWERSTIDNKADADVSMLENSNARNGDASIKPTASPERVGINSITSWVDVQSNGTQSMFYPASAGGGAGTADAYTAHAPLVLRDSQPYVDFLFINRRGAVETCSGMTKEAMSINVQTQQYSRSERPAFQPTRSLMAIGSDGRREWQMSSGHVTREWAEWWTMEFLSGKRKQWWMLWHGPGLSSPRYVPVIVKPAKNDITVYDKSKQEMPHVDFTVTLALEG